MNDPVMLAVATALATKVAEGLSEAGRAAFGKLVQLVRGRLRTDPGGTEVLESALRYPDDLLVRRLAATLAEAAGRDAGFREELTALWSAVAGEGVAAAHGGVVNQVSGTVRGTVVQARDVSGGITLGAPATADANDDR